jgi:hypothetical protein
MHKKLIVKEESSPQEAYRSGWGTRMILPVRFVPMVKGN